jgi:MSHA pilin protein MshC
MPLDDQNCTSTNPKRIRRLGESGFTLIELIMVIVMLGVLAVVAAPRIFNSSDFYARGFHDETLALLRYAQKTAIAQRRTVCVTFSAAAPATAKLTIASAASSSTCNTSLLGPNINCAGGPTGSQACINANAGVSYSATSPATVSFDGLGQPVAASYSVQVATGGVSISKTVTIESGTGYVHD